MTKYIAILRGINVGGKRKILMADLKELLTSKGFENVKSYIQSGNIAFDFKVNTVSKLENIIIDAIKEKYGFDVPTIVITPNEAQSIIDNNPYKAEDLSKLHVTFFKEEPDVSLVSKIKEINFAPDEFHFSKKAVYLKIADKYHKSRLSNTFFEKKLKISATTRNWKTVNKLVEF